MERPGPRDPMRLSTEQGTEGRPGRQSGRGEGHDCLAETAMRKALEPTFQWVFSKPAPIWTSQVTPPCSRAQHSLSGFQIPSETWEGKLFCVSVYLLPGVGKPWPVGQIQLEACSGTTHE